jgi:hypothetical protein
MEGHLRSSFTIKVGKSSYDILLNCVGATKTQPKKRKHSNIHVHVCRSLSVKNRKIKPG